MEGLLAAAGGGVVAAAAAAVGVTAVSSVRMDSRKRSNAPPEVPGLPLIGNLHQLAGTKPHETFTKWSETYGPIYNISLGAQPTVVLSSKDLAKEAMIEKYSSISTRKLNKSFSVITRNKKMVATSDYGDFHKGAKAIAMARVFGPSAQKRFRDTRNQMMDNMLSIFRTSVIDDPHATKNFRKVFRAEIFRHNMIQTFGEAVSSIYVEELGQEVSAEQLCDIMVNDTLRALTEVDWRDFFPYLGWIPNKSFEEKLMRTEARRTAVSRALTDYRKERIERGEARACYLDAMLAANTQTDEEQTMLAWEAVSGGTDTSMITMEWAMFEVARRPDIQERLYREIKEVCGDDTVTEDHLPRLPYLKAVFYETLRVHPPGSLFPPRFIHETTTLGGYQVPEGTTLIVNLHALNNDPKEWEEAQEFRPERFLDSKFTNKYRPITFGLGKRTCAGMPQATTILSTSMAKFVQEFTWSLKPGDEDKMDTETHFLLAKLDPLHVLLSPRRGR